MALHWTEGNRFTLLENGEAYFPRVFEVIAAARQEVLLETFILFDDKVGQQLREALLSAAGRGAKVQVLVDGWGSPDLGAGFLNPLLEAGVQVRVFDPAYTVLGYRINPIRRMHRKIVVVDGERAFVGGINYSHDHLAEFGPKGKQDYAVEIEGPLVGQIQAFCLESVSSPKPPPVSWLHRWRSRRQGRSATLGSRGTTSAAFVTRDNAGHRSDIEHQYRLALRQARHRVIIANAYFFPSFGFLRELRRASRRGVEVNLILQGEPDMPIVRTAALALHANLLGAGIKIFEYCERPLHGKVATIDDEWSTVGSSNLDPSSLALNTEANVFIRDEAFAVHMRKHLERVMADRCQAAQVAAPTLWSWLTQPLWGFLAFHLVRLLPRWLPALPATEQQIRSVGAP